MATNKEKTINPQDVKNQLDQLKQEMKANLEAIALVKFAQKIKQFKPLRKSLTAEIVAIKGKEWPCTIAVPESLKANLEKLQNEPNSVESLVALNANLQCTQLSHIPVLLKNCQLPTNEVIVELLNKILPHLVELDADLSKLDYALQLMLPRMREGEYLGTELLQEVIGEVQNYQAVIQSKIQSISKYHYKRYDLLQTIISYGHYEDYRLKLTRHDRTFCFELKRAVDYVYKCYVLMYDLVKKNYEKLMELKNMDDIDRKVFESFYS